MTGMSKGKNDWQKQGAAHGWGKFLMGVTEAGIHAEV